MSLAAKADGKRDAEGERGGSIDSVGWFFQNCPIIIVTHSPIGLQVVYQGGILTDLDEALYQAIGRDPNDEGCELRTGRRDLFWRCVNMEDARQLRQRLATDIESHHDFQTVAGAQQLVFSLKTEGEHWKEKLSA